MKYSERKRLIEEWKGVPFSRISDITTECLEFIANEIGNEVVDNESKTTKRDTRKDYLITRWFYRDHKNRRTGMTESRYDDDLSREFIEKVEEAIEEAKGDNARTEILRTILEVANELKIGIERKEASEVVHNFRYTELNGKKIKVKDESLKSQIDRFYEELGKEASAGSALATTLYTWFTNVENATELAKRLKYADAKTDEYRKTLEEKYIKLINGTKKLAEDHLHYKKGKIDTTKKDVMGLDRELE